MKKILLALAALFALTVSASAADLGYKTKAPQLVDNCLFCGWFIGAEAGYGTGTIKPAVAVGDFDPDGFFGGVSLMYRTQVMPQWFVGLSTNIDWSDQNDRRSFGPVSASANLNWIGTTTVQVGSTFLHPQILVYVDGGVAYGQTQVKVAGFSDSPNSVGWTLGAGVDYAFAPNWTAGFKYSYVDLGKATYAANLGGGIKIGTSGDFDENHMFMVNLKYKFAR